MEKRRTFKGRLIAAGETRTKGNGRGSFIVPPEAIRDAIGQGLFNGLACFVDHATEGPSVRRLVGVWHGVCWDDEAAAATGLLLAYETAETRPVLDLLDQWLADRTAGGGATADMGISLVFYPRLAADGRTVHTIVTVESADLVMFPASEGSRILQRVALGGDEAAAEDGVGALESEGGVRLEVRGRWEPRTLDAAAKASHSQSVNRADIVTPPKEVARLANTHNAAHAGTIPLAARPIAGDCVGNASREASSPSHSQVGNMPDCHTEPNSAPTPPSVPAADGRHAPASLGEASNASPNPKCKRPNTIPDSNQCLTSPSVLKAAGHHVPASANACPVPPPGRRPLSPLAASPSPLGQGGVLTQPNPSVKEKFVMNRTTVNEEMSRVALVRDNAALDLPITPPPDPANDSPEEMSGWIKSMRSFAAATLIAVSGLPPAVQDRLNEADYESVGAITDAIDRAQAELATIREPAVVQLGGSRPQRSALRLRDPLDEARELMGFFFGAAGATTPPSNMRSFADLYVALTGDVMFRGTFDPGRVLFSGATTGTLPNLAVDAMNRVVAEQFSALAHYRWYERIVAVAPNDGRLHDMKWITLGGAGDLPSVSEGAAYTELNLSDVKESAPFVKRGGYVGVTREMIKNSDVMQLQAIPRALATAAIRSRSAAVSKIFTMAAGVGPTLAQDSKPLFHNDHGNLASTALGSDATAWRAARAECFQHAELGSGKPLGVFPRFLLVPAELYDTALSILGYGAGMPVTFTPEAQDRGFADPRPIPLVVPDWTDATDWAYIVDPAVYPVLQMSYSQAPGGRAHPAPELFAVANESNGLLFTNDTLPIKVRDEFAVGVNGPRGIGKRNVSG